jgi:hypothetical protein
MPEVPSPSIKHILPSDQCTEKAVSFHWLLAFLKKAFDQLSQDRRSLRPSESLPPPQPLEVEQLASLLYRCMSAPARRYHNMHHLQALADPSAGRAESAPTLTPLQSLAIAFHDVVYIQVDRKIPKPLRSHLLDFPVQSKTSTLLLPPLNSVETPPLIAGIYVLFDIKPHQSLTPRTGLNEFLSAVAAARILSPLLLPWEIFQIVGAIEMTIPFRGRDRLGLTPSEAIGVRLGFLNESYPLHQSDAKLQAAVESWVRIANRDISGFASKDPGIFLAQTWALIEEDHPTLSDPLYSPRTYRSALLKVHGFFTHLRSEVIFQSYPQRLTFGSLSARQSKTLEQRVTTNLHLGAEYLEIKLMEVALLEAVEQLTGGGGSLALFRPLTQPPSKIARERLVQGKKNPALIRLFSQGRSLADGFDLQASALALSLYLELNETARGRIKKAMLAFFIDPEGGIELLRAVPQPILLPLLQEIERQAWIRKAPLTALLQRLK